MTLLAFVRNRADPQPRYPGIDPAWWVNPALDNWVTRIRCGFSERRVTVRA
jgi:hypothetical protein